jgi:secondary thiamine-phosphate synthase enzyme
LIRDVKGLGERLAPSDEDYSHNDTWGDGNGQSHIRASVIGPSLTVPFAKGKMALGTWQQIVVIDHDTRPRSRDIVVQIMGE